jgi:hypothetical protein
MDAITITLSAEQFALIGHLIAQVTAPTAVQPAGRPAVEIVKFIDAVEDTPECPGFIVQRDMNKQFNRYVVEREGVLSGAAWEAAKAKHLPNYRRLMARSGVK